MNNFSRSMHSIGKYFMEKSKFFRRNTTPKIISIVFAFILWLYVMGEVNPESIIELRNIGVHLSNSEELKQSGLVVVGQSDFTVNVKINGRRNDIYKISPKDLEVKADLKDAHKGINHIPIEINVPTNIRVEDIDPKQITVTCDYMARQKKPTKVKITGIEKKGFEAGTAIISPTDVSVRGPESLVKKVKMVVAEVNLKDYSKDITDIKDRIQLIPVDKRGKKVDEIELETKYATVIVPLFKMKEVPISPVWEGTPKDGFKITSTILTPKTVVVKGPKETIDRMKEIRTTSIDIEGIDKTTEKMARLILPKDVETPYFNTNLNIEVIVDKIVSKDFAYKKSEVIIENLDRGYLVDLGGLPDVINVQVEGAERIVEKLNKEDIKLYLNVKGFKEGIYSSTILYNTPKSIEKVTCIPAKVDFEVKPSNSINSTNGQDSI